MKYWLFGLVILCLIGCDDRVSTADDKQREATGRLVAEANREVGMPGIVNFQERKLMKRIYELRDQEKLITYVYIVDMQGHLHFLTKAMGYGLPYGTQFTNPERIATYEHTLPQPEPNGLFMPPTADATWIMAIDGKGGIHPMYVEPLVIVSPVPLSTK